jgi:hypothetical protein
MYSKKIFLAAKGDTLYRYIPVYRNKVQRILTARVICLDGTRYILQFCVKVPVLNLLQASVFNSNLEKMYGNLKYIPVQVKNVIPVRKSHPVLKKTHISLSCLAVVLKNVVLIESYIFIIHPL